MPSAKNTMLAAAEATDDQLISPPCLMRISAHPANFLHQTSNAGILNVSQSEWHLGKVLLTTENE